LPFVGNAVDAVEAIDMDAVVDCTGGDIVHLGPAILSAVLTKQSTTRSASSHSKLIFIHTSGAWVNAKGRDEWADEREEAPFKVEVTAWRKEVEESVLAATSINSTIIRPALLYGRSGSLTVPFFTAAHSAGQGQTFEVPGEEESRWCLVHTDDLADMYVRVVESAPICQGLTFIACNDFTERFTDVLDAIAGESGAKGWTLRKPSNAFEQAVSSTIMTRPSLARSLLGWQPRKAGLVDGMKQYYSAWLAAQGK